MMINCFRAWPTHCTLAKDWLVPKGPVAGRSSWPGDSFRLSRSILAQSRARTGPLASTSEALVQNERPIIVDCNLEHAHRFRRISGYLTNGKNAVSGCGPRLSPPDRAGACRTPGCVASARFGKVALIQALIGEPAQLIGPKSGSRAGLQAIRNPIA
jgi:hypothetical protein